MLRFLLFFICLTPALAQLPSGFVQRQVGRNLNPTRLAFSPNGRLFVADKEGKILEIVNDIVAPDPFMTLANVDTYNERGLSGLCFHPDFPHTPYFYVYYTVKGADHNRLSRFQVTGGMADPKSEKILFEFDKLLGSIHNGGSLQFGLDRKLYVGLGDGSSAPMADRLDSFLGKILRINDDGSIPTDNPFVATATGFFKAIYAIGFRNPFSMDIDPISGQILVGEVGGDLFEEVDDVKAGGHYGWPLVEGRRTNQEVPSNYIDPIYSYRHDQDCAITGLTFYNPGTVRFPAEYRKKAFFADYCGGVIHTIDPATGQVIGDFVTNIDRPIALATSPDGYLYYIARGGMGGGSQVDNTVTGNGSVYKVSYFDSGIPYITTQSTGAFVGVGEAATLSIDAVGQKPLIYRWYRNGKLITGAAQSQYTISSPTLADNGASFSCVVTNALGSDSSTAMLLRVVQGQRPVAHILQPLMNTTYQGGSTITYAGEALNVSQQPLANAKLTWWIDFHHEDHVHPALDPITGPTSGTYKVARVGETSTEVWYRVHLRATDVSGLTAESWIDVKPQVSTVTISSKPAGSLITIDGQPHQTDLTFPAVVGMLRTVSTKPYLANSTGFHKFSAWSNGQTSTIFTYEIPPVSTPLIMNFTALPSPGGNGLMAEYYTDRNEFVGPPTLIRMDSTIDYYWGYDSPDPKISADNFVARWSGTFQAPFSDTFTFATESDDGVRLWIDNKLVIDKWGYQSSTEWSASVDLKTGQTHTVKLEYLENQGEALVHLRWSSPQFDKAAISKSQLFGALLITDTEPITDASLTLFPQPAHDHLTVRYVAPQPGQTQIEVTDLLGRRVYQQTVHVVSGTNEYDIPVADWPEGLYHLAVHPADQSAVFRRMLVR